MAFRDFGEGLLSAIHTRISLVRFPKSTDSVNSLLRIPQIVNINIFSKLFLKPPRNTSAFSGKDFFCPGNNQFFCVSWNVKRDFVFVGSFVWKRFPFLLFPLYLYLYTYTYTLHYYYTTLHRKLRYSSLSMAGDANSHVMF